MIVINKGTVNPNILELTSNSQLLNSNYLFEFINDLNSNTLVYFTAQDLTTYKCRYNRFDIIESNVSIPLSGQVSLVSGMWTYNIYEASASTLSISGTTGRIISTGKVTVNGVDTQLPSFFR